MTGRHPESYRLISLDGKYYRLDKLQPVPADATVLKEDLTDHPQFWSLPCYQPLNPHSDSGKLKKENMDE